MTARQLTLAVMTLVLFAGVLHAAWNAIASAISDKTVAFALIGAAEGLLAVIALPVVGLPRSGAVAFAAGSAVIHIVYTAALLQSYRLGEFGRTYPLARGMAPLLVGLGAWFIAGEHLTAVQIAGTCTIAAALTGIVFAGGRLTRADVPATAAALFTGVMIASYTVVDGLGVRHAHNPAGYLALVFVFQAPVILRSPSTACATASTAGCCATWPPGSAPASSRSSRTASSSGRRLADPWPSSPPYGRPA